MTALHVSSNAAVQLTEEERRAITPSIQQFQLGEGSRGQRLFERGEKYGQSVHDPIFAEALDALIREEQQHSRYLAAFMESQSIPRVQKHWVDSVFRKLRGLAGLELSLTVLVTAELIAVPYYRALRGATGSAILKMICNRILDDEANHLKFQASMLARVASGRRSALRHALGEMHRLFLLGTMIIVWIEHCDVFNAAEYTFRQFKSETLLEFREFSAARANHGKQRTAPEKSGIRNLRRVERETQL